MIGERPNNLESLPYREGPPPETTHRDPHRQTSQNAPIPLQDDLVNLARTLPQVVVCDSLISLPGSRAFALDTPQDGPFIIGREFGHIHPPDDGSLHLVVPPESVRQILRTGWGELHPVAMMGLIPMNTLMIFGPRTREELDVVWEVFKASYEYVGGHLFQ
jgi:hypothetical protein